MSFSLSGGRCVAEPKLLGIYSERGIGISVLRFSVEWTIFATPFKGRVHSTAGVAWVRVDGMPTRKRIGQVWPETAWWDETPNETRKTAVMYDLFMRPEQLVALEQARQGHVLEFSIDLHGLIETTETGASYRFRGNATAARLVNPHEWAEILKPLELHETILVGVDLPLGNDELCSLLRKANEHLIDGRYDAAIGECRKALDSSSQQFNLGLEGKDNGKAPQTLPERRLALAKSIKRITHLAMHPVDGKVTVFSRDDAVAIVASTTAVINAIIADSVNLMSPPPGNLAPSP